MLGSYEKRMSPLLPCFSSQDCFHSDEWTGFLPSSAQSRTGRWPEDPRSRGNMPIGHGFHDFATAHPPELPTSPSVLLTALLFVRQNLTNSSFLVAWWIDSSCWIRRLFKLGREDFSWVTSGSDKTSELSFLSFPITEVSPINCARWSAESISCLLPFEDTKRHLRRTSIRIVFDKFIPIEEAFLSAAVSLQRRGFSPLSCPTSHANKEESLSIWPVSVLYARDVRCVPGQDFRKVNKDNMESKL